MAEADIFEGLTNKQIIIILGSSFLIATLSFIIPNFNIFFPK